MIRNLFKKFIVWAMHEHDDEAIAEPRPYKRRRNSVTIAGGSDSLNSTGMTFHLYAAEGGTVIETSFYNEKNDRTEHRLYIIPEGEDFTATLGQIVSMERIKSWH